LYSLGEKRVYHLQQRINNENTVLKKENNVVGSAGP